MSVTMNSDYQNVLFGGEVTDSLEEARSLGEFCYKRLEKYGDRVLLVSHYKADHINLNVFYFTLLYKG